MRTKLTWLQRISKARKRGFFTIDDGYDVHQWNRCAVGERFKPSKSLVDNHIISDIFSHKTVELGLAFTKAVNSNDFKRAEILYTKIQKLKDYEMFLQNNSKRRKLTEVANK